MLCDAGAHVVMACRSAERAKGAMAEVTKGGGKAEIIGRGATRATKARATVALSSSLFPLRLQKNTMPHHTLASSSQNSFSRLRFHMIILSPQSSPSRHELRTVAPLYDSHEPSLHLSLGLSESVALHPAFTNLVSMFLC